jgi:aminoglycoside phosphotransferase (APT) family kinase protein
MTTGRDNRVVPGGTGTVLRRRLSPEHASIDVVQEAALLRVVAEVSPLPVPRVLGVSPDEQSMLMERMPGEPLLTSIANLEEPAARRLGDQLGQLLAALGAVPLDTVRPLVPVEPSLVSEYHADAVSVYDLVRGELPKGVVGPLADFLAAPPPAEANRLRLCHNDLGAEHVFVAPSGDVITGIIDWSDASISDPCLDLGLILRDLGETGLTAAIARTDVDLAEAGVLVRVRFFARVKALEDFAFGLESGRTSYLRNAARSLTRLFR